MSKPVVDAPAPVSTAPVYNPLSKLAILGVSCGGLYALILVMSVLVALVNGTPLFLPDWLLLLPLLGAGLSLLGYRQIRNSEGTLSGEFLTRWGLWLSLLAGLGYGAYYLSTGLAIQQQANQFLTEKGDDTGFFAHLQEGNLNRAFLLTKAWKERQGLSPHNPKHMARFDLPPDERSPVGPLTMFRENDIVQLIVQAGRESKPIQPLGVKKWEYQGGEYLVERGYRIETDEMSWDILVPVTSNDAQAQGEARKWNVQWNQVMPISSPQLTPLGQWVEGLRRKAQGAFENWVSHAQQGKLKQKSPDLAHHTDWSNSGLNIGNDELQKRIRKDLEGFFSGKDDTPRMLQAKPRLFAPWKHEDGRVQFFFTMFTPAPLTPAANEPQMLAEIEVIVESEEKLTPMQEVKGDINWRVIAVKLTDLRAMPGAGKQLPGM